MRLLSKLEITDLQSLWRYVHLGLVTAFIEVRYFMEKINTSTCIYVSLDDPLEDIRKRVLALDKLNFVHVEHAGRETKTNQANSIISIARNDAKAKEILVFLANQGFHVYLVRDDMSSMVHHRRIKTLWRNVVAKEISVDENDIFYTVQKAPVANDPKLLVAFSSIAAKMYTPSLFRHFEQNFASIGKYIPHNAHIMRIADFGSVVGSFYLNSKSLPNNEAHIATAIAREAARLGISHKDVVLYGSSKGGTAATYYALKYGYQGVAVDPILSDEHYVQEFRDSHFTLDTFEQPKEDRFAQVTTEVHPDAGLSVICSTRSPQYTYIHDTLISQFSDRFVFLNSENEEIKTHPDVGPKTIPHTLSQINARLAGVEIGPGTRTVY